MFGNFVATMSVSCERNDTSLYPTVRSLGSRWCPPLRFPAKLSFCGVNTDISLYQESLLTSSGNTDSKENESSYSPKAVGSTNPYSSTSDARGGTAAPIF